MTERSTEELIIAAKAKIAEAKEKSRSVWNIDGMALIVFPESYCVDLVRIYRMQYELSQYRNNVADKMAEACRILDRMREEEIAYQEEAAEVNHAD